MAGAFGLAGEGNAIDSLTGHLIHTRHCVAAQWRVCALRPGKNASASQEHQGFILRLNRKEQER